MNGHMAVVEKLLAAGATPDISDQLYHFTPLMLAARQGHAFVVDLLVMKAPFSIDRCDTYGETALFDAVRNGHEQCVRLLLDAGANYEHRDLSGVSVLLTAACYNRHSIGRLLLRRGNCSMTLGQPTGKSSLLKQMSHGQSSLAQMARRQDVLEVAMLEANWSFAQLLVTAGCNIYDKLRFIDTCDEVMAYMPVRSPDKQVPDWLRVAIMTPRTLQELCRIIIRQRLGTEVLVTAYTLTVLPPTIRHYLTLPELEDI